MNAEDYLSQIERIDDRMEVQREKCDRLQANLERCTPSYTERVQGGQSDRYELVGKLECAEFEIRALQTERDEIAMGIKQVKNERSRKLLEMRYCQHASWKQIGCALGCQRSWVCRLHALALLDVSVPERKACR